MIDLAEASIFKVCPKEKVFVIINNTNEMILISFVTRLIKKSIIPHRHLFQISAKCLPLLSLKPQEYNNLLF
jgi:hypothetical protein